LRLLLHFHILHRIWLIIDILLSTMMEICWWGLHALATLWPNISWWSSIRITDLLVRYGLSELELWLVSLAIIIFLIPIWHVRCTSLESWIILRLYIISSIKMVVLGPQVLIYLISAISLGWEWDVITLVTLDSIWESSWLSLCLLISLNVVRWLMVLILLLMHILSSSVLLTHVVSIILVWLVASLLLWWADSWNRFHLSSSCVSTVLLAMVASTLTINRWHHRRLTLPIILSILSSWSIGIPLSTILTILLVWFTLANFSHLAVSFRRALLVVWMWIGVVYFLFSLHEIDK